MMKCTKPRLPSSTVSMLGCETRGRTGFSREGAEVVFHLRRDYSSSIIFGLVSNMIEIIHLVCSGMLGRCLECAFELGPQVFPFTPSAGTAHSLDKVNRPILSHKESINWVSLLRCRLIANIPSFLAISLSCSLASYSHAIARRRGKAGLPGSLGVSGRMVMLCRKSEVSWFVSQQEFVLGVLVLVSACMQIEKFPSPQKCFVPHKS